MSRTVETDAIVLRLRDLQDNHKLITLYTRELGIVTAAAYGFSSKRSRLKTAGNLFARGRSSLFHDTVKQWYRLQYFDITEDYPSLREDLKKFYTASLMAEIALHSFGGGHDDEGHSYGKLQEALTRLNGASGDSGRERVLFQHLWRFLGDEGFMIDLENCSQCGRRLSDEETEYDEEGHLLCGSCSRHTQRLLPPGCRSYLRTTAKMDFAGSLNVNLSAYGREKLKDYLLLTVQAVLGRQLKTIQGGRSLL